MSDNLRIWSAVEKTDPNFTKEVSQRGGFTAISANYQVKLATEQFGPIGIGWGYDNGVPIFHDNLVIVPVTFWHGDRANHFGPIYGCEEWKDSRGRIDSDATKKAETDGLTKALSRLGFNADVFMGLFDDQKYVEQRRREVAEAGKPTLPTGPINNKTRDWLQAQIESTGQPVGKFCEAFSITSLEAVTYEQMEAAREWVRKQKEAA